LSTTTKTGVYLKELEQTIHKSSEEQHKVLQADGATLAFNSWIDSHSHDPSAGGKTLGRGGGKGAKIVVHSVMPPRRQALPFISLVNPFEYQGGERDGEGEEEGEGVGAGTTRSKALQQVPALYERMS